MTYPSDPTNPYQPHGVFDAPVQGAPVQGAPVQPNGPYVAGPYAPGPYAGSPYGAAPYAASGYVPVQNQMALIALICSLAGVVTGVSVIAGIVCGHIALSQLKQTPQQTGRGMAVAALWVGYGLLAIGLLLIVAWFVFMAIMIDATSAY